MKTRLVLLACALASLLSCAQPEPSAAVFSSLSYEQAAAQAQSEHRLLLVDLTASWCPPCQMMERTTWPDDKVKAWIAAHAIAVQIDVDEQRGLASQFGISGVPTLVVVKDGAELGRQSGGLDPDGLLAWLGTFAGR